MNKNNLRNILISIGLILGISNLSVSAKPGNGYYFNNQ